MLLLPFVLCFSSFFSPGAVVTGPSDGTSGRRKQEGRKASNQGRQHNRATPQELLQDLYEPFKNGEGCASPPSCSKYPQSFTSRTTLQDWWHDPHGDRPKTHV